MGLFWFFIIAVCLGATNLPTELAKIAEPVHTECLSRFTNSEQQSLHSAVICGAALPPGETYEAFRKTGLIHLIVVSGSHLLWLEFVLRKLLDRFSGSSVLIAIALTIFTFAARLDPPILRAAFSLAFAAADKKWALGWTNLHRTLFAGILCLALYPEWFGSMSLLLSWAAALVLATQPAKANIWRTQAMIYIVLLLFLIPLTPPHPITIAFNVLLAPVIAIVLLPLSALVCLIPPSAALVDPALEVVIRGMQLIARYVPEFSHPSQILLAVLWLYLFTLQILWLRKQILARRAGVQCE